MRAQTSVSGVISVYDVIKLRHFLWLFFLTELGSEYQFYIYQNFLIEKQNKLYLESFIANESMRFNSFTK